jgi:8-oxo-dGTP diphosphatase
MIENIGTADIIMCRIVDGNVEILLTLRSPTSFQGNKWCIPGGHLNDNEDPLEGAIREVKEETGIYLQSVKHKIFKLLISQINDHRNKCGITYSCLLPDEFEYKIIPQQTEVSDIRWFDAKKIPYDKIAFDHGDIINYFFKKLTK